MSLSKCDQRFNERSFIEIYLCSSWWNCKFGICIVTGFQAHASRKEDDDGFTLRKLGKIWGIGSCYYKSSDGSFYDGKCNETSRKTRRSSLHERFDRFSKTLFRKQRKWFLISEPIWVKVHLIRSSSNCLR